MSQERFDYLLQRFKADLLSEEERAEWQQMVRSEAYRSAIDADIEKLLTHPTADPRWNTDLESEILKNIVNTTKKTRPEAG